MYQRKSKSLEGMPSGPPGIPRQLLPRLSASSACHLKCLATSPTRRTVSIVAILTSSEFGSKAIPKMKVRIANAIAVAITIRHFSRATISCRALARRKAIRPTIAIPPKKHPKPTIPQPIFRPPGIRPLRIILYHSYPGQARQADISHRLPKRFRYTR